MNLTKEEIAEYRSLNVKNTFGTLDNLETIRFKKLMLKITSENKLMNKAISGSYIGGEMCDALGLDDKKVISLNLDIPIDGVATVTVTQYVFLEEIQKVKKILTKFNLVPKEEE